MEEIFLQALLNFQPLTGEFFWRYTIPTVTQIGYIPPTLIGYPLRFFRFLHRFGLLCFQEIKEDRKRRLFYIRVEFRSSLAEKTEAMQKNGKKKEEDILLMLGVVSYLCNGRNFPIEYVQPR